MKRNHLIVPGCIVAVLVTAALWPVDHDPLRRLKTIERRMIYHKIKMNRSFLADLVFVGSGLLAGFPHDEVRLEQQWNEEMQKQVVAGNLVKFAVPTTILPTGYFKSLQAAALARFKDGTWSCTTSSNGAYLLLTAPPHCTNDWLRIVREIQSAH